MTEQPNKEFTRMEPPKVSLVRRIGSGVAKILRMDRSDPAEQAQAPGPDAAQADTVALEPEEASRLEFFIVNFLRPILQDYEIETVEETPLIVAFHALGIEGIYNAREQQVKELMLKELCDAAECPRAPLQEVWNQICSAPILLTPNDYNTLQSWLNSEAQKLGQPSVVNGYGTAPIPDPAPIHRQSIQIFYRLRDHLKELKSQPETLKDAPPDNISGPPQTEAAEPAPEATPEPLPQTPAESPAEEQAPSSPAPAALPSTAPPAAGIASAPADSGQPPQQPPCEPAPALPAIQDVECTFASTDEVLKRMEQLRAEAESIIGAMERHLAAADLPGMAFDECRASSAEKVIIIPHDSPKAEHLWFIGDLHGDYLALDAALQTIEQTPDDTPACIAFLGDMFDDGEHGYEVVLRIFKLLLERQGQICILAGNHSDGLAHNGSIFTSTVSPSDFADWLNADPADPLRQRLGKVLIDLIARMPRALFFSDGLLAAHGGIPHSDRWDGIRTLQDLNSYECLRDFIWTRAHERARRKIPNRASSGCEFGIEDFNNFCAVAGTALGFEVKRMVRGHTHVEERYAIYEKYVKHQMLTINTMGHRLPREIFGPYERVPCIARRVADALPEVYRLHLPATVIREIDPEPVEQ